MRDKHGNKKKKKKKKKFKSFTKMVKYCWLSLPPSKIFLVSFEDLFSPNWSHLQWWLKFFNFHFWPTLWLGIQIIYNDGWRFLTFSSASKDLFGFLCPKSSLQRGHEVIFGQARQTEQMRCPRWQAKILLGRHISSKQTGHSKSSSNEGWIGDSFILLAWSKWQMKFL